MLAGMPDLVNRSGLMSSLYHVQEIADYIVPFAIRVICDLRVADLLRDGPRPVEEIAQSAGAHAPSLRRVLRTLAGKGLFTETSPGHFGLTEMGALLRSDHPLSLAQAYTLVPSNFQAWAFFDHTVRTGEPAFEHVHGVSYYEHLAKTPEDAKRYDGIQEAGTKLELRAMLHAYRWEDAEVIADIGGNNGAFLAGVLARHKHLRGVLLDLPHVAATAPQRLAQAGVLDRCDVVAGDFFATVGICADRYVLKRVLYDWDDQRAKLLLGNIRAAMPRHARLVVLDPVVTDGDEFSVGKVYDLLSMAMLGGITRTQEELEALLAECGFTIISTASTAMFPVIEAIVNAEYVNVLNP